jgi:drug/metabolite transporter (DMT)-like permease
MEALMHDSAEGDIRHSKIFRNSVDISLLVLLSMLWGASYTFIKIGVESIPPVTLIAARTTLAGGMLLALLHLRGIAFPRDVATWRRFLIQAALHSAVPFTLIAWAQLSVDAGLTTILSSTSPIFAFLMTWAVTRHENVDGRKLFGVMAGLGGICLVIGVDALGGFGEQFLAQMAIVLATLCYAGAAIFGRNFQGLDPMVPATGSLVCGAALLIPISLAVEHPWSLSPSRASLLALLGLSVFSTALASVLYFRLLRRLGSVGVTAQAYLRVPFGVSFGVLFLGETLAPTAWAGLVCVVAGVCAMTLPGRSRPAGLRSGPA